MRIEKTKNVLYKIILIALIIFVAYVTYCSIFNIYRAKEELKPIVVLLGTITLIFVFLRLKKLISKIPKEKNNIVAVIVCIIFFTLLVTVGLLFTSVPTYDLSNVVRESQLMMQNEGQFTDNTYFSVYENQSPLAILIYYIYSFGKMLGISNLRTFAIIVNALFMSITAFFTYLSVKKLENYKLGLTTLLFFVLNPIFYIYTSYYYSDTLCMPFAAISIHMFISAFKSDNNKKKIILGLFGGIILAIGFKIRVVLAFIFIATIVGVLLNTDKKKKYKIGLISIISGFLLGILIANILYNIANPKIKDEKKFPITHWIMMGFNFESDGRYTAKDFLYTNGFDTYSGKLNANISKIKERINDAGPSEIVQLLAKKLSGTWSNGDYDYITKFNDVAKINDIYEYIVGNKKIFVLYLCQIFKAMVLLMYFLSLIKEYRNKEKKYRIINIAFLGAFIFYLIWEAKERYSLSFLPWMMLMFGVGLEGFEKITAIKSIQIQDLKVKIINNFEKIFRLFARTVFILSIFLLIVNFHKYTIKTSVKWDKVVAQNSYEGIIVKVSNRKIKQTFKASKSFNVISIRFENKSKKVTNYKFVLKNEKGKILNEQVFSSDKISDNKFKIFYFDNIKPIKEEKYIFEIFSEDATDNDTIGIYTVYLKDYSAYEDGDMIINDEVSEADSNFIVANERIKPYVSKKVYITMSAGIILIEIFAFYPYLKPKKINLIRRKNK